MFIAFVHGIFEFGGELKEFLSIRFDLCLPLLVLLFALAFFDLALHLGPVRALGGKLNLRG